MKIFRILVVLSFALVMGAACPPKNVKLSVEPPLVPKRVYDPGHGVAIVVPDDWKVTFRDGNPFLFAQAPGAGPYGPMVNVVTEAVNQRLNPYDYLQANVPTMRLSMPGLEVVRSGYEIKNGVSMAWVQYTYPRGQLKVEALSYAQTMEYQAWVVTAVALKDKFNLMDPQLRYICQSLAVDAGRQ